MASIQEYLDLIKNAIYGKDVRQAIHDGIQQCYYDGKAGSTDLEARQRLDSVEPRLSSAESEITDLDARVDQIVAPSGEAPSAAEVADGRIVDGVTYNLIGDAIRAVDTNSKSDIRNYNAYDIVKAYGVPTNRTHNGITYSWNDFVCTVSGTSTGASFDNIVVALNRPDILVAGKTYNFKFTATDANIMFKIFFFNNETQVAVRTAYSGVTAITVPSNADGFVLRLDVASGKTVSGTAKIVVTNTPTNEELYDYTSEINSVLREFNSIDVFVQRPVSPITTNGVTFSWNGKVCSVSGTPQTVAFYNLTTNPNAMPTNLVAGNTYQLYVKSGDANVKVGIFYSTDGSNWGTENNYGNGVHGIDIPNNATGMLIRIQASGDTAISTTIEFAFLEAHSNKYLSDAIKFYIQPRTGINMTSVIQNALSENGMVLLGKGTYNISNLVIPEDSCLVGMGNSTILKNIDDQYSAVTMRARSTIKNLQILGTATSMPTVQHEDCGIVVAPASSNYRIENVKIESVRIVGFRFAGIRTYNTGYPARDSVTVTNCEIATCFKGMSIESLSEYGRYSNIICRNNYVGLFLEGGNNTFTNCSFDDNYLGVQVVAVDNNGHGGLIGCTLNHSNSGDGYAFVAQGITNGFVISGCQFHYGTVLVESNSKGILFNGCEFGSRITLRKSENSTAIYCGCVMVIAPTIANSGMVFANCYDGNGAPFVG